MATTHAGTLCGDPQTTENGGCVSHEDEEVTDTPTPLVIILADVREVGRGRSRLTYEAE